MSKQITKPSNTTLDDNFDLKNFHKKYSRGNSVFEISVTNGEIEHDAVEVEYAFDFLIQEKEPLVDAILEGGMYEAGLNAWQIDKIESEEVYKKLILVNQISDLKTYKLAIKINKPRYLEDIKTKFGVLEYLNQFNWFNKIEKMLEDGLNELETKYKNEAEPLESQLPELYKNYLSSPNALLRSSAFPVGRNGARKMIEGELVVENFDNLKLIESMPQYQIFFKGYSLDIDDRILWDTLIYIVKAKKISSNILEVSIYEVLKLMKKKDTMSNRKSIKTRLDALAFGLWKIKSTNAEYTGHLIDSWSISDITKKLIIRFDKKIAGLFSDNNFTRLNIEILFELGLNKIAKWLYCFLMSHDGKMPFDINDVLRLSGSDSELKEFRRMTKTGLELIVSAYQKIDNKSKFSAELIKDKIYCYYDGKENWLNNSKKQKSILKSSQPDMFK